MVHSSYPWWNKYHFITCSKGPGHFKLIKIIKKTLCEGTKVWCNIPSDVTSALEVLVAFKSNFLRFLQTQMKESPLSEIAHSHNSSSLSVGCNTLNNNDNQILITSKTLQSKLVLSGILSGISSLSSLVCMILYRYSKEKFCLGHSRELKG